MLFSDPEDRKDTGPGRENGRRNDPPTIKRELLEMIFEAAKESHPMEFAALLRKKNGVISELVLLPGTKSGTVSAIFMLHMLPIDRSVVGTVHSHPGPSANPSGADLSLFRKFGRTHIIAAMPYDINSWKAYNWKGDRIALRVEERRGSS